RTLGATVIDADQVSRDVTKPGGAGLRALQAEFGGEILTKDGQLDRTKLRDIAFADPARRKKLESILHPLIATESLDQASEAFQQGHHIVIYEAPLLIEAGRAKDLHGIICVVCSPKNQMERLLKRDGLSPEMAQRMIHAQMAQSEKVKHANWVLDNNAGKQEL